MGCDYCGKPCGSRQFCDEACYDEYNENMKVFQEGIKDEYPVGDHPYFWEPEPKEVFPW